MFKGPEAGLWLRSRCNRSEAAANEEGGGAGEETESWVVQSRVCLTTPFTFTLREMRS